ncbi:MAG TPA: DUF4870 domain-containing protein [Dongiaceae bacterium]|jgi:uncharacterized membrane protein|nr:DUF4870 domain-containing protein [Dongiaceae bacterium]
MDTTPPPTPIAAPANEDRTIAIVSYLTLLGFIVALVLHSNKKTQLGAYHLRQMLGFFITGLCMPILMFIPILGWIAFPIVGICLFVFWIMGLIAAINGQMKPMPVVGPLYQKWFANTFQA